MPLRSGGCYKCKSRKIRCDETRPQCHRCTTHGVQCPGYKFERPYDIEIRDETSLTAHRANGLADCKDGLGRKKSSRLAKSSRASTSLLLGHQHEPSIWTPPDHGKTNEGDALCQINPPSAVLSPAANRSELHSTFFRLFIPQEREPRDLSLEFRYLDFIKTVAALSLTHPAVIHALDAVTLLQIGSIYNDRNLLYEGVKSYTRSLANLASSLPRPGCAQDDEILAAASILSLCEFFDEVKQRGHGWICHLQGTQKLLEARGPDSIKNHLSKFVYWNTVHSSIANGLLQRKAVRISSRRWRVLESELLPSCEYGEACSIGRALTSLLERHDRLDLDNPNSLQELDALIVDCRSLQTDMLAFYPSSDNWPLQPLAQFSHFYYAVSDRTLSHGYNFSSYLPAFLQTQCWLRTYFLRDTMQSLYALRERLLGGTSNDIVEDSELLELILNLCRCVPFLTEPFNATVGHIACFLPLHIAAGYFQEKKLWFWLRWVRVVQSVVFDRGMSMPNVPVSEILPDDSEDCDEACHKHIED